MPFTVSHAVVALPFRRLRWWSAPAVAAGAMAPDFPLFVKFGAHYVDTHELWAAPTIDLATGYAALVLWGMLLRPALFAVAPASIRRRLPAGASVARFPRPTLGLVVSIVVGAITHITWDTFTHQGRLGTRLIPILNDHVGSLAVASGLQYLSSVGGLTVLIVFGCRALARAVPAAITPSRLGRLALPALLASSAIVLIGLLLIARAAASSSLADAVFDVLTGTIDVAVALLTVVGLVVVLRPIGRANAPAP